jgi:hypothetical protein
VYERLGAWELASNAFLYIILRYPEGFGLHSTTMTCARAPFASMPPGLAQAEAGGRARAYIGHQSSRIKTACRA